MILFAGAIVICLIAIVFVVRMISPSAESSRQGQAMVVANFLATSVNTLSTMDAGRVQKDFGLRQPLLVEVYSKKGVSYVKATYDENGSKSYEVPILVSVEPLAPVRVNLIEILKDQGGKIYIKGNLVDIGSGAVPDVPCAQTSEQDIRSYITSAASRYGVEEALIKAVIMQETGRKFSQCNENGGYVQSKKGAIGLMQLMPKTAAGLGVNLYDPQENIMGGTRYLSDMIREFKDKEISLAAYNAGPGNVRNWTRLCLASESSCSDWNTLKIYVTFKETLAYVPGVMGYYKSCYAMANACDIQKCKLC